MLEDIRNIVGKYLDKDLVGAASGALAGVAPIRLAVYDLDRSPVIPSAGCPLPGTDMGDSLPVGDEVVRTCAVGDGQSALWFPLLVENEPVGILAGFLEGPVAEGRRLEDLKAVVRSHADLIARLIERRRTATDLTVELSQRYEDLNLASQLGGLLRISQPNEDRVAALAALFSETLDLDLVAVVVPSMGIVLVHPPDRADPSSWRDTATALLEKAAGRTTALVINNIGNGKAPGAGGFAHAMVALLDVDGSPGYIAVMRRSREARFFTIESKMLDLVARQISVALTNSRIIEARVAVFDAAVFALARLAESRDPETGKHLERVQNYSRVLAHHLAATEKYSQHITREYIENIRRSSPLHDIGKVGIRDSVLLKPGRFTPEEFAVMKTHATIGGDTLRDAEEKLGGGNRHTFLTMGRLIAYSHHEKWNGTGYPAGLAGDAIPLSARIVALADVYDAVTSKRCYKDASSHEKTREMLVKDSGTHFDPDVIGAFVAGEKEFLDIAERLSEPSEVEAG